MPSFSSAVSAQRNASLRAAGKPSVWSRVMWMSGTTNLLQQLVPLFFGQIGQSLGRIIEPPPIAALALEQGLDAGHEFVVRRLRAERRVVGTLDIQIVAAKARRVAAPAVPQFGVARAEVAQRFLLQPVAFGTAGVG